MDEFRNVPRRRRFRGIESPGIVRASLDGHGRTGFTLIELLIVIAVIAIMITIGLPGLLSAKKNAHEADTIAMMREIITAQELFRERALGGAPRFGTLNVLADTPLQHQILIRWPDPANPGQRNEYIFEEIDPPSDNSWCVRARPLNPGVSGDMYFAADEDGFIRRSAVNPPNRAALATMSVIPG